MLRRRPGVDASSATSTGEVIGIDADSGIALAEAIVAAGHALPKEGRVFVSVANRDSVTIVFPAKRLADLGFRLLPHGWHGGRVGASRHPGRAGGESQRGPDTSSS